jgi:predicted nucleic acid-binding protein
MICGEKAKISSRIDPEDAVLAGISRVHEGPVITRNVKRFSRIEGVSVETY